MSSEIDVEVAAVKVIESNFVVVSVYRSPNGNIDTFIDTLSGIVINVIQFETKLFIAGDFSINFLNKSSSRVKLLAIFQSFNLHSTTLRSPTYESCIDKY